MVWGFPFYNNPKNSRSVLKDGSRIFGIVLEADGVSSSTIIPKVQDPSYKTDLDFLDCFKRENAVL